MFNIEPGFKEEATKAILDDNNRFMEEKNMFFGGVYTAMEN